jgi:AraC-like DNA-binding protein
MESYSQSIATLLVHKHLLLMSLPHVPHHQWTGHIVQFAQHLARFGNDDREVVLVILTELCGQIACVAGHEHAIEARCRRFAGDAGHAPTSAAIVKYFLQHLEDLLPDRFIGTPTNNVSNENTSVEDASSRHRVCVRTLIEENYAEDLTNAKVARLIGRSPRDVRNELRELGLSLRKYLTTIRMEHAQQLLHHDKVEAVAWMVGYKSKRQFIRQFKLHTGMVPSHFRGTGAAERPDEQTSADDDQP